MTTFLPKDVQAGLDAARKLARRNSQRLRVRVGGRDFKILRAWQNGFSLDADEAAPLRGLVDLYEGPTHLSRCLIVASEEDAGELRFEYKLMNEAAAGQPLDFVRAPNAPVALLPG